MVSIIFYSISLWFLTFFNCLLLLLIFVRFLVRVSYLEIYNEDVRDLLGKDQHAKLEVCEVKKYIVAGCVTLVLYQLGFKVPVEKIRKLIAALISVPWFPFIKNYVGTTIRFFVLLIKNYFLSFMFR